MRLLKAVIEEYTASSEPVGSQTISKKYILNCSAATIRNEMAKLIELGFLEMLHTSSGRVPTHLAYRLFLDELMEEEDLSVLQEVAMKQRLWQARFEFDQLLRNAILSLSDLTKELAFSATSDGYVVHAGAVNILDYFEFWDIEVAKAALYLLDRYELLEDILKRNQSGSDVSTAIGTELGYDNLKSCALVFAPYTAGNRMGYVGVLGPSRMRYPTVIPAVRYTANLVGELSEPW